MATEAPEDRWPEAAAQAGLVLGSVLLAALLPFPIFAAWALAYLSLWLLSQAGWRPLSPRLGLGLLAVGAVLALLIQGQQFSALPELEGLRGISTILGDRFARDGAVEIAPPLVRDDRPQSYYVSAPGAARVSAWLGGSELVGGPLGPGLFRLDYDPTRHGRPPDGPFLAKLEIDGHVTEREMLGVQATAHPRALSVAGARIVGLSEETDQLFIVTGAERVLVPVGDGPVGLAIAGDLAIVSARYGESLALIDLGAGRVVRELAVKGPPGRLALRNDRLAVAFADRIELYSVPSLAPLATIALRLPDRLSFGATPEQLLVSTREGHDLLRLEGERIDRLTFGRPIVAMAVEGTRAVVAVSDFLPDGGPGTNHEVEDQLLTIDLEAFKVIARTPTAGRDEAGVLTGAGPIDLVPNGNGWLVAFAGTGEVARLDDGRLSPVASFEPGIQGVAEVGGVLFVSLPWSSELRSANGSVRLDDRDPSALRRRGERGFYEATLSGTSCASCHPDEDSDQALHDIGQGTPRPTLSIRGVTRTSPFLRGGSYPSLASLDEFAHGILGGYRVERPDRSEALAAFVESLARGTKRPSLGPQLTAGYAAFCKAACNECHRPPAFTDLAQYPSTFLFPDRGETREILDTPSLLGVGETAPYLYDGRASTLESIFEDHDQSRRHGAFARLDAVEKATLFAFLRAL